MSEETTNTNKFIKGNVIYAEDLNLMYNLISSLNASVLSTISGAIETWFKDESNKATISSLISSTLSGLINTNTANITTNTNDIASIKTDYSKKSDLGNKLNIIPVSNITEGNLNEYTDFGIHLFRMNNNSINNSPDNNKSNDAYLIIIKGESNVVTLIVIPKIVTSSSVTNLDNIYFRTGTGTISGENITWTWSGWYDVVGELKNLINTIDSYLKNTEFSLNGTTLTITKRT